MQGATQLQPVIQQAIDQTALQVQPIVEQQVQPMVGAAQMAIQKEVGAVAGTVGAAVDTTTAAVQSTVSTAVSTSMQTLQPAFQQADALKEQASVAAVQATAAAQQVAEVAAPAVPVLKVVVGFTIGAWSVLVCTISIRTACLLWCCSVSCTRTPDPVMCHAHDHVVRFNAKMLCARERLANNHVAPTAPCACTQLFACNIVHL